VYLVTQLYLFVEFAVHTDEAHAFFSGQKDT